MELSASFNDDTNGIDAWKNFKNLVLDKLT